MESPLALIADQDLDNLDEFTELLQELDYAVLAMPVGELALAAINGNPLDVVIMNCELTWLDHQLAAPLLVEALRAKSPGCRLIILGQHEPRWLRSQPAPYIFLRMEDQDDVV